MRSVPSVEEMVEELAASLGIGEEEAERLLLAVGARTVEAYMEGLDTEGLWVYTRGAGGEEGTDRP